MKRLLPLLLLIILLANLTTFAYADATFDLTPFKESENYAVEFDDMNDSHLITLVNGGRYTGFPESDDHNDFLMAFVDIKVAGDLPPIICTYILLSSDDWAFINKVILKIGNARYTFEIDSQTEVLDDGDIFESITLLLTDKSVEIFNDIAQSEDGMVKFRLVGSKRSIDGYFAFSTDEAQYLYNDYVASGSMDNDFSLIELAIPCDISRD